MEHISNIIKRLEMDLTKEYFEKELELEDTMSTLKVLHHLKNDCPEIGQTLDVIAQLIRTKYHDKLHEDGVKRVCNNKDITEILTKYPYLLSDKEL